MRFFYVLVLVLMLGGNALVATPAPKPKAVLRTDSASVSIRHFNEANLNAYRHQTDFQYNEPKGSPSLWTRFWRWFWHLFEGVPASQKHTLLDYLSLFFKYLFIILGIGALVFLVLRLVGVDVLNLIKKKPANTDIPYQETLENIHEINFDTDIEQAISQQNYRLAVRLLYLKSLKQLNDAGLIHWQIDKTNSIYISEIKNTEQREAFTILTRQFEYVWYGEFAINNQVFQNISILFTHFKKTLA